MSNSKFLSDVGWKDIAAKNNVKDNGLLKKLQDFKKVADDEHGDALKLLDETLKLAGQLRKDKKIAPAASKYLDELTAAAETTVREVSKAKAEADKAGKAKAEAEKKANAEAAKKSDGEDDDEDVATSELLTTKLKPLLRRVAKGERLHALLAKSGKQVVVLLSIKPIPPAKRKMLADHLGTGGTKYYPGHCELEAGAITFVLKAEVAGMSKLVKVALLEQTGMRLNKLKCRGEDGDDEDEDGEGPAAEPMADQAGTPEPAVAPAQAAAAAAPAAPAAPATPATPAAAPAAPAADAPEAPAKPKQTEVLEDRRREFKRARAAWVAVKARAEADLEKVKDSVRMAYMDDAAQFPKIVAGCKAIDDILDNLDDELRNTLDQYASTSLRDQRKLQALGATAKEVLDRYEQFVAGNKLMQAIDKKEFADVTVHAPVTKALRDLRKALA
jgi:hypothetical protein